MTNFEIIQIYQRYLLLEDNIELPFATIVYDTTNPSRYENNALINTVLTKDQLVEIEKEFAKLKRNPAIYFENTTTLQRNISFLQQNGYTNRWNDSYLFFENIIENTGQFDNIVTVQSPEDLEIFLKTFDACFQKDDPQNPYGELKDYLDNTRKMWHTYGNTDTLKYFIIYDGEKPVATSALTSHSGIGYISAVGSLREVRGKGFGKRASLYATYISQLIKNNKHFLITEAGMYPHEFYKRIGFIEKFQAIGMYKK